jgi:murein DD-endopeptidase MepM/ murein hydrolase activator NlpD
VEGGGAFVVLCHVRRGSVEVGVGQRVTVGAPLARCGNSGNSTEPHVHLQAIDGPDPGRAVAVPLTFRGRLPRDGDVVDAGSGIG